MKVKIALMLIVLFAAFIRVHAIDWDSYNHFHPDERMLIMVTERIEFPGSLDPDFFNYGSLPVYILALTMQAVDFIFNTNLDTYDGLLLPGRLISTAMDLGTVFFVFLISLKIFKKNYIALLSSLIYALSFFPIQNSHFFIVDTFFTFFSSVLLFFLLSLKEVKILLSKNINKKISIYLLSIALSFAMTVTSKITAIIFLPTIFITFLSAFVKIGNLKLAFVRLFISSMIFAILFVGFSFVFMPYGFLRYEVFLRDILNQVQMNNNPYVFPYTLQYVQTTPYIYYLKNIFIWGIGPVHTIFFLAGGLIALFKTYQKFTNNFKKLNLLKVLESKYFIFLCFYLIYFLVIGNSAVKFMRYMLPIYPFIAIISGFGLYSFLNFINQSLFLKPALKKQAIYILTFTILAASFIWTKMFLNIYETKNTRIRATQYILSNVDKGATIAVEHWDDRVPIYDFGRFNYEELTLYDIPDNSLKWTIINDKLKNSDYIVIASNRLYSPLQKLQDCSKFGRCYPLTKKYYEDLFSGKLGFKKMAEFTSYPHLNIFNKRFEIVDDSADESFTVYDHPKIIIFERM